MKNMKKILAVAMALVMLLCMVPMSSSAAGELSTVYVGELYKTKDNLLDLLRSSHGLIRVKSVKNDENFYEFTFEEGTGFVLTFFNAYEMSEMISKRRCGLYADGDLTVRLDVSQSYKTKYPDENANITFDLNTDFGDDVDSTEANGWVVDGTLTIECINTIKNKAVLNIDASDEWSDKNSTGIKAENLLLNNVVLNVNGGNIGADVAESIGMINSTLNANMKPSLSNRDERLFNYSIRTENLLEANSAIAQRGDIRLKWYWSSPAETNDNSGMERDPHAYSRSYAFTPAIDSTTHERTAKLRWRQSFPLFADPTIPSCITIRNPISQDVRPITGKKYDFNWISISGNNAIMRRPTPPEGVVLTLALVCGKASYTIDTCRVFGELLWWQRVLYFLSMDWLR